MADRESWHLDKRVPIAFILVMLGQFALVVAAWTSQQDKTTDHEKRLAAIESQRLAERMALVEAAILTQKERDQRQDSLNGEAVARVELALQAMNAKLDRLVERRHAP